MCSDLFCALAFFMYIRHMFVFGAVSEAMMLTKTAVLPGTKTSTLVLHSVHIWHDQSKAMMLINMLYVWTGTKTSTWVPSQPCLLPLTPTSSQCKWLQVSQLFCFFCGSCVVARKTLHYYLIALSMFIIIFLLLKVIVNYMIVYFGLRGSWILRSSVFWMGWWWWWCGWWLCCCWWWWWWWWWWWQQWFLLSAVFIFLVSRVNQEDIITIAIYITIITVVAVIQPMRLTGC